MIFALARPAPPCLFRFELFKFRQARGIENAWGQTPEGVCPLSHPGKRIPTNDIWIAAHTLELNATLVTADPHFKEIPLLDLLFVE